MPLPSHIPPVPPRPGFPPASPEPAPQPAPGYDYGHGVYDPDAQDTHGEEQPAQYGYGQEQGGQYAPPAFAHDPQGGQYAPPAFAEDPSGYAQPAPAPVAPAFVEEDDPTAGLSAEALQSAQMLLDVIGSDQSSEVIINGPNEVLYKQQGARYHIPEIRFGDGDTYHRILNQWLLSYTDTTDRIDGVNPLVEGQMELPATQPGVPPMLARVHILCPPLVQFAKVTIAKKARYEYDLDKIASTGAMTQNMSDFLKAVAHGRLTTVVSGPTGAGKSTLLQAMTHEFDQNDRIIVIEDTPELRLPLADVVYLCSTSLKPGMRADDVITTEWLVKAANRMRMDRIIVGEVRGAEMAEWLIAANSGAEGSATTIHADNPRRALDKMLALATKSPTAGSEMTLRREIAATVQIIVQAGLIDGRHVITHVEEVSNTVRQESGVIATQTLFEFDKGVGRHVARSRPSEELTNILKQRGVQLNNHWFAR